MQNVTGSASARLGSCVLRLAGSPGWVVQDPESGAALRHALSAIDALWLARLAFDGPQPREALARWCWPKAPPTRALNNLRQRLHRTRRLLGAVLVQDGERLSLARHVQVLVEAPAAPGLGASGAVQRAELLVCLDALLIGRPLLRSWLEDARDRWRAQQLQNWDARAQAHEHEGDAAAALALAEAATQLAPADADGWLRRLRLLCDAGRFAEARRAWRKAQRLVEPADETLPAWLALQERIDAGAAVPQFRHPTVTSSPRRAPPQPQLGALTAPALSLLRCAALAGDAHNLSRAAAAMGWSLLELADPMTELQARGWLDAAGNLVSAAQAQPALDGVPVALRRAFHAALAHALQQEGARPELCAQHWAKAERWTDAAAAWAAAEAAADRENRRFAALSLNDEVAASWLAGGHPGEALAAGLRATQRAHTLESAAELARRCDALEVQATTPAARRAVALHRCRLAVAQNDPHRTEALAQRVLDSAAADGDWVAELAASGWMAVAWACSGRGAAARAMLDRQAARASALVSAAAVGVSSNASTSAAPAEAAGAIGAIGADDAGGAAARELQAALRAQLDFLGCQGWVLHTEGCYLEAITPLQRAVELAARLGDGGDLAEQLTNLALCANSAGERTVELSATEQVVALWQRLGEPDCLAADTARVQLATVCMGLGRYRESLALLLTALPRLDAPATAGWHWIATHRLAHLWLRLGQPARARHALPALTEAADAGVRVARALVLARLEPATPAGRDAAWRLLQAAWADHRATCTVQERHSLQLGMAAVGPDDEAIAQCSALLEEADLAAARGSASLEAVARAAALRRSERLARLGKHHAAMADLDELGTAWLQGSEPACAVPPFHGIEDVEVCRIVAEVARAAAAASQRDGAHATGSTPAQARWQAQAALALGVATVERIAADLPAELREAFEHRHPHVIALRRLAAAGNGWQEASDTATLTASLSGSAR